MNGFIKNMQENKNKKGWVIWLTGLPCSGKTSLSKKVEEHFKKNSLAIQCLDGDVLRQTISKDLGFSKEDRNKNIERVIYISKMLSDNGVNVVTAFVSPYRDTRKMAKKICSNFLEIFVKCDLRECQKRDSKGMYKKALMGEIKDFTGVQDPYQEPKNPDFVIETDKDSLENNAKKLINFVEKKMNECQN